MLRRSFLPSKTTISLIVASSVTSTSFRFAANNTSHYHASLYHTKRNNEKEAAALNEQQQKGAAHHRPTSVLSEIGQKNLAQALMKYASKLDTWTAKQYQESTFEQHDLQKETNTSVSSSPSTKNTIVELSFDENDNHSIIQNLRHDSTIVESSGIPPASAFWNDSRLLRKNRFSRLNSGLAVVGGADTIKRIMHSKANPLTPRCVFVPDDVEELPEWLLKTPPQPQQKKSEDNPTNSTKNLPIVVVRAPRARINHDLLSAEKCDGFAAQFQLPVRLPREFAFISSSESNNNETEQKNRIPLKKLNRIAVCHGLRVPGNVGAVIKSAYRNGYDGIVLDRCCELTGEKVLRAAGEAAFDPNFHIFEFGHKLMTTQSLKSAVSGQQNENDDDFEVNQAEKDFAEGASSGLLLKRIAAAHNLLPLMMIPAASTPFASHEDMGVVDVMTAAKQFHYLQYLEEKKDEKKKQNEENKMGTMIVVGGEANGLNGLASEWNRDALFVPLVPVCLQMDNTFINSVNVASAASTAMYFFRPSAKKEFEEYFNRGIVPPSSVDDDGDDEMSDLAKLMHPQYVLSALKEAKDQSERLLK